MNILIVVQLLNSEYEIHHSQRTLNTRIFKGPGPEGRFQVPYVSGLHLSLPLLKDRLSVALKTRLGVGALCPAERAVLETALIDLHGDLPRRPATASRGGEKPSKWAQVRDLLFRSRALDSEETALGRLARLAGDMYSEDLMRRFGLHEWSHVEQGFGREWARFLPCSVFGPLLFDSGEHYREPTCYVKIWVHDIAARNGAGLGLAPRNFVSIPAQGWALDHLAFLTAAVGLDEKDNQGLSLMHAAILDRRPDVVRQLVVRGTLESGSTPLSLAIAYPEVGDAAEFLARYPGVRRYPLFRSLLSIVPGELINAKDENGETPLHILARYGDRETIEAALGVSEINPDSAADDGATPLANAVMEARVDVVKILAARRGVDIRSLRRPFGPLDMSPLDYAKQGAERKDVGVEYVEVLEFLRECFKGLGENLDECPSDEWDGET
ncbi:uncharacterized protein LY79DRAFT_585164 [Colletotrichum navitas]|uniref:Ankyrin repeat protein n=1 Tax=Colletotrichum navitas TaxID=681940 RepID=A0AAD8UVB4_9PEZI|nr:uncharacterized protein LY79DRAFT_585164 [Colletotrichum navitas]KAK1565862.1 hypothetical protein LY79DRAFT_585164 [Colletotrichum navitas]